MTTSLGPNQRAYDHINPSHYKAANGMEAIDVIEAFVPDKPYRWAPLKYLLRCGKKPGQDEIQELRKAIWWIEREIAWIRSEREQTDARAHATVAPPFPIARIRGDDGQASAEPRWKPPY